MDILEMFESFFKGLFGSDKPSLEQKEIQKSSTNIKKNDFVYSTPEITSSQIEEAMNLSDDNTLDRDTKLLTVLKDMEDAGRTKFNPETNTWELYKDIAGVSTIGYGHALTPTELRKGRIVIDGEAIDITKGLTDEQADKLLLKDTNIAKNRLRKSISDYDSFSPEIQDSLVTIMFNTGDVSERTFPKLLKAIRENDLEGIRRESRTSSGGKPLTNRHELLLNNYLAFK